MNERSADTSRPFSQERHHLLSHHAAARNLYYDGKRLPYDPALVPYGKELRKSATREVRKLWRFFRTIPMHVYRQRPIDRYIVDFYIREKDLVIEIDGGQHYTQPGKKYDAERTAILEAMGLKVIRFSNYQVRKNLESVCAHIWRVLELD